MSTTLYQKSVQRFDELRLAKRLFYEDTAAEVLADKDGFQFEFRLITNFAKKPMPGHDKADNAKQTKPDPFGHPDKDYVLDETSTHLLQLNMFNALRPQFILHPIGYAPQTDLLNEQDFAAALEIWGKLDEASTTDSDGDGDNGFVLFYNCCPESGSSQPYKHMQIIPKPPPSRFQVFPDEVMSSQKIMAGDDLDIVRADVKHLCLISYFDKSTQPTAKTLLTTYLTMSSQWPSSESERRPHNVILTRDWLCTIPRRTAGRYPCFANSMGMLGMVWVASEEERQGWEDRGYSEYLVELGFPSQLCS